MARAARGGGVLAGDYGSSISACDDYWKHGSVCFDYAAIACPAWIWGGWADLYRDSPLRLAENLTVPHKVTVGPWGHLYPHEASPAPAVGFLQETLRWWDHWLKGRHTAVMQEPPLRFYMMESVRPLQHYPKRAGRWVGESALAERARDPSNSRHQLRRTAAARRRGAAQDIGSPQTTGLAAGEWGSFANPGDVPGDQ